MSLIPSVARTAQPSHALAAIRWLVLTSLLGLNACATAPPVAAVSPQPDVAAVARAPAERPVPEQSGQTARSAPAASPSDGAAPAPVAAATVADPVLEPVHATPADRSPGAGRVIARGTASWYGQRFHGRRTASGERFDMNELTAAHRTLPFGTRVRVRHVATGREVVVRINDRGPRSRQRIIDLSLGAARELGVQHRGTAEVQLLRE
jgi:rare lipoprotein A